MSVRVDLGGRRIIIKKIHMKLVRDNAMITGECNALRQQLLEATDVPFIKAPKEKKAKK